MRRERDKPYLSRQDRAPYPKRHRQLPPPPPQPGDEDDAPAGKPPPAAVVVMGLPTDCSVLDLKSRLEIYGAISRIRIRIDRDAVGHITFRSKDSAEAAIAASLDASFGITMDSKKLQVLWATDPLAQWREGVGAGVRKEETTSCLVSKLLRGGVPLSKHGRGNKLASAIVNPRSSGSLVSASASASSVLDVPFQGRDMVAYDDIL